MTMNNKNIQPMSPTIHFQKFNTHIYKRRFSLHEKQPPENQLTQREELRHRYHEFMQTRRKYIEQSPISPQTQQFSQQDDTKSSKLSIRLIRKQKNQIGQALRRAITKYNYEAQEKQKKIQQINRKKMKYEKILKIREENQREKILLNQSRIQKLKQYSEQILKVKKSVDLDKMMMGQSRIKMLNEKKTLGAQRRQQLSRNKFQIRENRSKQLEQSKKLRECISLEQKQLRKRRKMLESEKYNTNSQHFLLRVSKQIDQVSKFEKRSSRTISKFENKILQLQKSNRALNQQLKSYDTLLKNGSTLRKLKPKLKVKINSTEEINKNYKTQYSSDEMLQ